LFAVQEIDGQKRNVLQIPDFLDSDEAAMHIGFWLEHRCDEFKKWSAAQAGPPKLTAVGDQDKQASAWSEYVGAASTPMEYQRREAERIAAKFCKELPSNWALKWFGPQTDETGLFWDVLQAIGGPIAAAKMAKAEMDAKVQSAKPSARPPVSQTSPSSRAAVETLADSYQNLPSRQRPDTVARLQPPSGRPFNGRSGYAGEPHEVVRELIKANPGRFQGNCAECDAVEALRAHERATGERVTTVEQARKVLAGSYIQTARVRPPSMPSHRDPHEPCDTCQPLLDALGINYR
jgi:hypothetical protein